MKDLEPKWIGLRIKYSSSKSATVIDEDATHLVLKFDTGEQIASAKSHYNYPNQKEDENH
jgi:hypothetical protein